MELDYSYFFENALKMIDDILVLSGKEKPNIFNDYEPFTKKELESTRIGNVLDQQMEYIEEMLLPIVNNLLQIHGILNYEDENSNSDEVQYYFEIIAKKGSKGFEEFLKLIKMSEKEFCKINIK